MSMLMTRARVIASAWRARAALTWMRFSGKGISVVIDHAMGGGANKFRQQLVDRLAYRGHTVLLLTPLMHLLSYEFTLYRRGRASKFVTDDPVAFLDGLGSRMRLSIHVNEVVSFNKPVELLGWCRERKSRGTCALTFYLHDFHAICPAWTLIGLEKKFCGIPADVSVCANCLPNNHANTLGFSSDAVLTNWRQDWCLFLAACDRIIAFSRSSVKLLRQAYPELDGRRVLVIPHQVDLRDLEPVHPAPSNRLRIAVAGHISVAKGALILKDMAALIRAKSLPIGIVVFGTLEQHDASGVIEVVGEYNHADLPELMRKHGISMGFLPSVCPETFSFVTSELIAMQLPLAVFPIGAPAERAAMYDKGLVISRIDASTALEEIMVFAAGIGLLQTERLAG